MDHKETNKKRLISDLNSNSTHTTALVILIFSIQALNQKKWRVWQICLKHNTTDIHIYMTSN